MRLHMTQELRKKTQGKASRVPSVQPSDGNGRPNNLTFIKCGNGPAITLNGHYKTLINALLCE
jgi:hypothetical protein